MSCQVWKKQKLGEIEMFNAKFATIVQFHLFVMHIYVYAKTSNSQRSNMSHLFKKSATLEASMLIILFFSEWATELASDKTEIQ